MRREYLVEACRGLLIEVKKGQEITVIDLEGKQVVDFFAQSKENPQEFLSTGVTVDCNASLKLKLGDKIFTNLYKPMFELILDEVGEHDLLHPACRPQMYDYFYGNGEDHPNCFDNINKHFNNKYLSIRPINLFMYSKIHPDGSISVEEPLSRPGDKVVLRAMMDLDLAISACCVSESKCNGGFCSDIKVIVE